MKNQPKSKNIEKQVSPTMNQLATLLREIENMKATREQFAADTSLSATDKKRRLDEMDHALLMAEHMALGLMQKEIRGTGDSDQEEADESAGYFQWSDPATPEEAFTHVRGILPILDEMKAKINAIELCPKTPLREKAERVAEMKEAVEFVSRRVVALSEAWLESEAA